MNVLTIYGSFTYLLLEQVFSFCWPTRSISKKIVNLLSKFERDGAREVSTLDHLFYFEKKCKYHKFFSNNEKCMLFVLTFKG